jgi:cytochrome P450
VVKCRFLFPSRLICLTCISTAAVEFVLTSSIGGDTIATSISATLFYLSQYPECYYRLSEEVRHNFANAAELTGGPKLAGCRYLRACIDEALRMSSPVSGTLWRELASDEASKGPLIVDGHVVPPGTQVGVNTYSLHHNENYFPEPFIFRPERWMVEDKDKLRTMHNSFAAFSTGARGCAGKPMAYLESSLVVAKILWHFDFEPGFGITTEASASDRPDVRGYMGEYQLRDVFNAAHDGPYLVFHPHGDHCKEFETK